MKYRVRVKDRSLPPGRVSLWAASLIITTLRVALRAEAASISNRKSAKGRLSKLQQESIGVSLVGVESGTGVMVFEPDVQSLIDLPAQTFEGLILESNRNGSLDGLNIGIQKAILNLEPLFRDKSTIDWVEFIDERGSTGRLNSEKIERIRLGLVRAESPESEAPGALEIVGRLLELNLANQTFQVHGIHDRPETIAYQDFMEPIVRESLERFVTAQVTVEGDLLSLETLDAIPDSRFYESTTLFSIMAEQGIKPLTDFGSLEMTDIESVPLEEFIRFRRGETA